MKNWFNKKVILGILVVVFISGVLGFFQGRAGKSSSKTRLGAVVKQDVLQRVTIAGFIAPVRKTVITAPYNGYLKKLFVKIGDKVKQGDPIVTVVQSLQSSDTSFPLRSPLEGTVVQIEKSEGEFVKDGDQKEFIVRIDDLSKLYIYANTPEIDRIKVKLGQEVVVSASAILNQKYKGIIRELSLAAKEKEQWGRSQVVEFPIRIEIIDKDEQLKPGMSAVIDIITSKKEKVLFLRHEFIRKENETYFVILDSGKRKDIQVGIQNEEGFEIVSGLGEGEKIRQIDYSNLSELE